ncbi:MAG TPA: SDR family NAD(P)-dependent oxidoreductase [Clostridiaceae bacterium]|nr:SDR family NAD(P)-dependent oxidoreductase [Clostridiaceae bacterium]
MKTESDNLISGTGSQKKNKQPVVFISGGSGGIGFAVAKLFAQRGYRVYELSRREILQPGVTHIKGDVTQLVDVKNAVEQIIAETGQLNIVICNAGFGISGPIELTPTENIKRQFDVNFMGTVNMIQATVPYLRQSGGGRILCVSSVAAVMPIPYQSFYTCTKASINQLVLTLNNELRSFNIQAVALMPGDTKTGFTDRRIKSESSEECMKIYGSIPGNSITKMEKDERTGNPVKPLAKRIVKLTTQKRTPKPIQGFGLFYRTALVLAKFLPIRFVNYILYKMYAS